MHFLKPELFRHTNENLSKDSWVFKIGSRLVGIHWSRKLLFGFVFLLLILMTHLWNWENKYAQTLNGCLPPRMQFHRPHPWPFGFLSHSRLSIPYLKCFFLNMVLDLGLNMKSLFHTYLTHTVWMTFSTLFLTCPCFDCDWSYEVSCGIFFFVVSRWWSENFEFWSISSFQLRDAQPLQSHLWGGQVFRKLMENAYYEKHEKICIKLKLPLSCAFPWPFWSTFTCLRIWSWNVDTR